jgi:hypothetical protein
MHACALLHLHRDWAHPCHIRPRTGLAAATAAPGLGLGYLLLPHLPWDWDRTCASCCSAAARSAAASASSSASRARSFAARASDSAAAVSAASTAALRLGSDTAALLQRYCSVTRSAQHKGQREHAACRGRRDSAARHGLGCAGNRGRRTHSRLAPALSRSACASLARTMSSSSCGRRSTSPSHWNRNGQVRPPCHGNARDAPAGGGDGRWTVDGRSMDGRTGRAPRRGGVITSASSSFALVSARANACQAACALRWHGCASMGLRTPGTAGRRRPGLVRSQHKASRHHDWPSRATALAVGPGRTRIGAAACVLRAVPEHVPSRPLAAPPQCGCPPAQRALPRLARLRA